ncbi:MAG: recombinase RecA [Thermoleophilaceae bacterium]
MDKDQEKAAKAREAALNTAITQIQRSFGEGSIMKMGDDAFKVSVSAIPTGALSLDLALGVGGLPRGRIVEIFGPEASGKTTLIYHVLAEAQKQGGICAFIDAEHAMDPIYAKRIGVDVDELLVSQPDHGEQALEIADLLIRSGTIDVVAIDSVAALTPKAELEGQMGDQTVGLQARMMSQAMRKLAGNLNRANTLCVLTNQIREKVGVMFGCFHYDARVVLADGSTEKIGKIVNQRMPVEVMSMDQQTGEIAPRPVVEWYDNGEAEDWLQFEVEAGGGSGKRKFACTPNHMIFTPEGERQAWEIEAGDEVLVAAKQYALSDDQMKLIMGSLLGDGSMRYSSAHNASFRVGHGERQREYCEWKQAMLSPFAHQIGRTGNGIGFDTIPMRQLATLRDAVYAVDGRKHIDDDLLARLDERAIAAWYCDDGTFGGSCKSWGSGKATICVAGLAVEDRERVADRCEELGMGRPTLSGHNLLFSGERTRRFQERIAPYVHPSMAYKLHPDFRGRFAWDAPTGGGDFKTDLGSRTSLKPVGMKVLRKYAKPPSPAEHDRPSRRRKYDLQVEGNRTYLVDHVVVHNSPETQPGGRALKFYSSQRLDIRRIETLKEGTEAVGNRVRVKVVKNKVAAPFRQAEFDIDYGTGISTAGCLIDLGIEHDIVTKSGSFFSYGDERLGQGRNNSKAYLREHPDRMREIEAKIYAAVGIGVDEEEPPVAAVDQPVDAPLEPGPNLEERAA